MSVSIDELCNVLYDKNGPSKIGIELEILDNDGNISPTAYTDLHEFLLSVLIKGIFRFNLIPNENNINNIKNTLQIYFNRININLHFEIHNCDDFIEPCKIYFNIVDTNLHIIKSLKTDQPPEVLKDIASIYLLNPHVNYGADTASEAHGAATACETHVAADKKRKFSTSSDVILKINFSFLF